MPRVGRRNVYYFILLAALLAIIFASYRSFSTAASPTEKSLGDLLTALDNKQVVNGTFNADGDRADWTDNHGNHYRTVYPAGYQLVDKFHANGVPITVTSSSASNIWLTVILPNVILFLLIGGFMWYVLRMSRGRGASIRFFGPKSD